MYVSGELPGSPGAPPHKNWRNSKKIGLKKQSTDLYFKLEGYNSPREIWSIQIQDIIFPPPPNYGPG